LLRRVCQLIGLSMRSRQYRFQDEEPIQTQDIHDMTPVTKDGFTKIQMKDVVDLIEYGRACLNQNQLSEAHGALQESLVYLYQAVGVMHEYVAVACSLLAQVYHAGGSVQQAILFEQRALCLYERLKGFDSYQVIHSHNFLATLWCKQKNGEKKAAKHMIRHLYLQRMSCGQYHSDLNNSLIKLGTIYQAVGRLDQAAKTYQYALQKSVPNTIDYATCLHLLAKAYHLSSKHKEALTNVREAYKIYKNILSVQHTHTQKCAQQMKYFTMLCVQQQQRIAASNQAQLKAASSNAQPSLKKKKAKKKKKKR